MINCLLQHTLRSLCSQASDSESPGTSKWVYAVFWRIVPRNYPPPKWDYGVAAFEHTRGNKRNWILVWEDGFCDFTECERTRIAYPKKSFGAEVFFKMSHEVYNFGEGLVGKVAAENSHKWVFGDRPNEPDSRCILSPWNAPIDTQPRAWDFQFNTGIQTIALISVREGVVQLGSFNKTVEDVNLVMSTQRKLSYIQSIPGVFSFQRPYPQPTTQPQHAFYPTNPLTIETYNAAASAAEAQLTAGTKRVASGDRTNAPNMGWNTPQNGMVWPPPSLLLPAASCSFGTHGQKDEDGDAKVGSTQDGYPHIKVQSCDCQVQGRKQTGGDMRAV